MAKDTVETEALLKEIAVELYDIQAVKFGDFTTEGGIKLPLRFNLGVITYPSSSPQLILKLAKGLFSLIDDPTKVSQICGFPYIATPLTTLMPKKDTPKEENDTKNPTEDTASSKKICMIIDEIITSGNVILQVAKCMKKDNPNTIEVYVIFDLEQGGKQNLENHGIKIKSIFAITQYMKYLLEAGKITPEIVKNVDDYVQAANQPPSISTQDASGDKFKLHKINE